MRSTSCMSVSFSSAAPAGPGNFRPKWVCMFNRPGTSHLPSMRIFCASAGTAHRRGRTDGLDAIAFDEHDRIGNHRAVFDIHHRRTDDGDLARGPAA